MSSYTEVQDVFQSVVRQIGAKIVFGDPVTAEGKTIVPVAKIRFGFGGGGGQKREGFEHGGGGGGGLVGKPVGVIEISREGTRFIPIRPPWNVAAAVALGVCLGYFAVSKVSRLR